MKERLSLLETLLAVPSVGAKVWAAAYLLSSAEERALRALNEVSTRDDIHGFRAGMILKEWHAGSLVMVYK